MGAERSRRAERGGGRRGAPDAAAVELELSRLGSAARQALEQPWPQGLSLALALALTRLEAARSRCRRSETMWPR